MFAEKFTHPRKTTPKPSFQSHLNTWLTTHLLSVHQRGGTSNNLNELSGNGGLALAAGTEEGLRVRTVLMLCNATQEITYERPG